MFAGNWARQWVQLDLVTDFQLQLELWKVEFILVEAGPDFFFLLNKTSWRWIHRLKANQLFYIPKQSWLKSSAPIGKDQVCWRCWALQTATKCLWQLVSFLPDLALPLQPDLSLLSSWHDFWPQRRPCALCLSRCMVPNGSCHSSAAVQPHLTQTLGQQFAKFLLPWSSSAVAELLLGCCPPSFSPSKTVVSFESLSLSEGVLLDLLSLDAVPPVRTSCSGFRKRSPLKSWPQLTHA